MKMILALALAWAPLSAHPYTIVYKKGDVKIVRQGKEHPGDKVQSGDKILVAANSLAILKSNRETLKLTQDTDIVVKEFSSKEGPTLLEMAKGGIIAKVNKKSFSVRTKTAAMGVRGTQFFASDDGTDLWMCVQEGEVTLKDSRGRNQDVPAGKGVFVKSGKSGAARAFEWTKKINWDMESKEGALPEGMKIEANYQELLDHNYD